MLSDIDINDRYAKIGIIFLCLLRGILYSFTFGFAASEDSMEMLLDWGVSSVLFLVAGTLMWNIQMYGMPDSINVYRRLKLNMSYCLIFVAGIVGMESLFMYFIFPERIESFVYTLPSRIFSLMILYNVVCQYFVSIKEKDKDSDEDAMPEGKTLSDISLDSAGDNMEKASEADAPSDPQESIIERVTVRTGQKIKVIPVDELIYIKAEDDYVSIVTAEGHWLKNDTMKNFEMHLPFDKFARVHRSYIVNIAKISKIERYGQKQLLQLTSGASMRISSSGYKILREKLNL